MAQPTRSTEAPSISQLRAPLKSAKPGATIPRLGLGTWQAASEQVEEAVRVALECGIRHVDTASEYGVEKQVGAAIRRALETTDLRREDLHVTTKVRFALLICSSRHCLCSHNALAALERGPRARGGGVPQVALQLGARVH